MFFTTDLPYLLLLYLLIEVEDDQLAFSTRILVFLLTPPPPLHPSPVADLAVIKRYFCPREIIKAYKPLMNGYIARYGSV